MVEIILVAIAVLGTLFGGMYCWMAQVYVIDHNWPAMKELPAIDRDGILNSAQSVSFFSFAPTAAAVLALAILLRMRNQSSH